MTEHVLKFLDEWQPCRVCKLPTITKKLGGRIPLHPSCDPRFWSTAATPDRWLTALNAVLDTFGPLAIVTGEPDASPNEIGPCANCRHPIRRYGRFARGSYCSRCRTLPTPPGRPSPHHLTRKEPDVKLTAVDNPVDRPR